MKMIQTIMREMDFKVLEPSPHSSFICKIRPVKSAMPSRGGF